MILRYHKQSEIFQANEKLMKLRRKNEEFVEEFI